jgi:hypothetical protein
MMGQLGKDVGAPLEARHGGSSNSTGAAPAALTGTSIDRLPTGGGDASPQQHESCVLLVAVEHQMAIGVSATIQLDPEHAPGSAADPAVPGAFANVPATHQPTAATLTQTLTGTGALVRQLLRYDLRLTELDRHVRFNVTAPVYAGPAGAGDVIRIQEAVVLGGAHNIITRARTWIPQYTL